MRKLRSDSTFSGLPAGQQEQVLTWLFNEGMSYAAVARRVKKEFGLAASVASVGRLYRHVAEDRRLGELALAAGSVEDFRMASRKLLGQAALRACIHNYNNPGGNEWKPVVALMKLVLKDQEREMSEQRLTLELQRVRSKP